MAPSKQTVLIIGGTGAQGAAIAKVLSKTDKYTLLVLTRNTSGKRALELASIPNVELVVNNSPSGYDVAAFSEAAKRSDVVFVNTDGFALGEIAETFWGIRLYELSAKAGVKHLIYSGLDYNGKASGYDPDLYVTHYEGKARVQEWMHAQDPKGPMAWTIIRSGPYAEVLSEATGPRIAADGSAVFTLPLGEEGQMPFVGLDDFGGYVDWVLSNPEESRGLDFGIAIEHAGLKELAAAYTAATGRPATYEHVSADDWVDVAFARLPKGADTKIGFMSVKDDNALTFTYRENFTRWFNLYKASAGNKGLITRDYAFLDKILPGRDRSMEGWMKRTGYTGQQMWILNSSPAAKS